MMFFHVPRPNFCGPYHTVLLYLVVCDISKKYRYHDNLLISLLDRFLYHFSRFRYYQKVSIIINISINQQHLVCDCAITLEMKFGSVQSSHFKSLSTSFLGLVLVLCNSLGVQIVFVAYL